MCYVIRDFKGPEVEIFDHLYLKKDKYFDKQHRKENPQNDDFNKIQPSKFS